MTSDNLALDWQHELAIRSVCDALEQLTNHIELIDSVELLDALTAYLQSIKDYIVVADRVFAPTQLIKEQHGYLPL